MNGEKHLEYIIVPKKAGIHTIPAFSLSYFSPQKKMYQTLTTDQLVIDVVSGSQVSTQIDGNKEEMALLNTDLSYLKPVENVNKTTQYTKKLFFIILGLINAHL